MELRQGDKLIGTMDILDDLRVGADKPAFIFKGDEVISPNPIRNGLVLWYDFKAMSNAFDNRGVAKDLSGNGNDGTLQNFNYTAESGYQDGGLKFDGVDDFISIPETDLITESMAVQVDGNVYSYDGDEVTTVGDDGVEVGGRNLATKYESVSGGYLSGTGKNDDFRIMRRNYNVTFKVKVESNTQYFLKIHGIGGFHRISEFDNEDLNDCLVDHAMYNSDYRQRNLITSENTEYIFITTHRSDQLDLTFDDVKLMAEKGTIVTDWTPAPEDFLTDEYRANHMHSLKLYNHPLTPEEIAHNYQIEKARFNLGGDDL